MSTRYLVSFAALCAAWSMSAHAERQVGWDFGGNVIYQGSQDINFEGGSFAGLDDDLGLELAFAYRFNSRLELAFGLDWNAVDYNFEVANGLGGLGFSGQGDLESFTPHVGLNFNLMEGDFTPYVSGIVGWSFIDTNIPDSPPTTSCWWDPWWGYVCGTWQSTRSIDELIYGLGAGIRWDVGDAMSLRFGYEKRWLDLSEATSTPGLDIFKIGIVARY